MSNNKYLAERLFDDFWGMDFPPLRCGLVTTLCMASTLRI